MLCLTLTVANSISDHKAMNMVSQLAESLNFHPDAVGGGVMGFEAAGGRQVQGFLGSAEQTVGFILSAARSGNLGVHLLVIPRLKEMLQAGAEGEDMLTQLLGMARQDGGAALREPGGVKVVRARGLSLVGAKVAPELGPIESTLQLLGSIERRRSEEGQEAGLMINAGNSQSQAAQQLGVSQQAVSARLQAGYWYESRNAAYWLAAQLEQIVSG